MLALRCLRLNLKFSRLCSTEACSCILRRAETHPQVRWRCSLSGCSIMVKTAIESARIEKLNDNGEDKRGQCVLYWMQASVRAHHNPALEYAIELSNSLSLPLVCVFGLYEKYPNANERHFAFLLEGVKDAAAALQSRGVKFYLVRKSPPEAICALSENVASVVTECGYLRLLRQWRSTVAKSIHCSMYQIEGNVVVPVRMASGKEETGARTIRPKITKQLNKYLKELPEAKLMHPAGEGFHLKGMDSLELLDYNSVDNLLQQLDIDRSVPRVTWIHGGFTEADKWLKLFVQKKLKNFATQRNEPTSDVASHMSPYLHFGQISPVYVALQVRTSKNSTNSAGVQSFLEEMIVRRELAINFVFYNSNYDSIESIPDFAKKTLMEHKGDQREYIYSLEELEAGMTHDEYWNACQREMLVKGKMQGYMRMYWAKKILEWSATPEEAYERCLFLNDKYELDGRDPNGFTGVAWCFGKHDQGWKERAVFGKVRYMNAAGLKRKFKIDEYVQQIELLVQKIGLPPALQQTRKQKSKRQLTMSEAMQTKRRKAS